MIAWSVRLGFLNFGFIAVQFFNSILLVYYKTLKEQKTVLY